MKMIVAVVAEGTPGAMASRAGQALAQGADLVEFRLDHLPFADLEAAPLLARDFGARAIATLRSADEGGKSAVDQGKRARALRELATMGFALVDAEMKQDAAYLDKLRVLAEERGTKLLVSAHPPKGATLEEVERLLRRACSLGHVGKVAVLVEDTAAALHLMEVSGKLRAEGLDHALIAMGAAGQVARARAEKMGSALDYVVAPGAAAVAPGQLTLKQALALRSPGALLLGLLGHPLGHSLSPAMHNAALDAVGLSGLYVPLDVPPQSLGRFVQMVEPLGLAGFNVTIPHKEAIIPHLDELEPTAEELGAVNTVLVEGGLLVGHNTDPHGFLKLLQESGVKAEGRQVLVAGAGGGARAVVLALQRRGAHVSVFNRHRARVEALIREFPGVEAIEDPEAMGRARWDIVVNCTPLGMAGNADPSLPVPTEALGATTVAIDLVYNPRVTPFLREASRRGAQAVGGLPMLIHQGALAFELWTGKEPPVEAMRRAAEGVAG